jgi:VanZ family protein
MRTLDLPTRFAGPRRWVIVPATLLTLAWLVATHVPKDQAAELNILKYDWLAHGSGYMVMAACWLLFVRSRTGARLALAGAGVWLALVLLGAIDEVTQPLAGRDCSRYDWLADATGAAIAVIAVSMLVRRFGPRSGKEEVLNDIHDGVEVAEHHPKRHNP